MDIYTEPENVDPDTLANLGPLRALAGIWESHAGLDVHPVAEGTEEEPYVERIELHPCDPQMNGPQVLYGLRYHIHIVKPGEVETFHDQVGYWLWEPATQTVMMIVAIPRGQIAMATGTVAPDAKTFELVAKHGSPTNGICSAPFIQSHFKTTEFRIRITVHADGTWTYDQDTVMEVGGRAEPFHHRDRATLTKVGEPTANPLMR